jgi:hypothetical protein
MNEFPGALLERNATRIRRVGGMAPRFSYRVGSDGRSARRVGSGVCRRGGFHEMGRPADFDEFPSAPDSWRRRGEAGRFEIPSGRGGTRPSPPRPAEKFAAKAAGIEIETF